MVMPMQQGGRLWLCLCNREGGYGCAYATGREVMVVHGCAYATGREVMVVPMQQGGRLWLCLNNVLS